MMDLHVRNFKLLRKGKIFVISAPSGTGKTVLINEILKSRPNMRLSVSYTTRSKRAGEVNGKDYVFTSKENFEKLISEGFFLEYNSIFDNYYGIPNIDADLLRKQGENIVFIVEYHGYKLLKELFHDIVGIYILPPSFEELARRLSIRNTDHNIQKRLSDYEQQLQVVEKYDYLVINDDIEKAKQELNSIISSEILRTGNMLFSY